MMLKELGLSGVFEGLKLVSLSSALGTAGAFTDHIQPVISVIK